jgi:hypothetical protein
LRNKFENEIDESPPNAQQYFIQYVENVTITLQGSYVDGEKSQEHLKQEELVEEINIVNNDGKYCHCIKEECFEDFVNESRIWDVVRDKKKD